MTSPTVLVPWLQYSPQSSDWSPVYSLLQDSGIFWIFSESNISAIFLSFCSSLTKASLLAALLAWRLLRKAMTWAGTAYLFHSMNFSDRKGSCSCLFKTSIVCWAEQDVEALWVFEFHHQLRFYFFGWKKILGTKNVEEEKKCFIGGKKLFGHYGHNGHYCHNCHNCHNYHNCQ